MLIIYHIASYIKYNHILTIIYFYSRAIRSFTQVIYVDPNFSRINEINIRLGLMFKVRKDYQNSLRYFQLALHDSGPCSFSKFESKFSLLVFYPFTILLLHSRYINLQVYSAIFQFLKMTHYQNYLRI